MSDLSEGLQSKLFTNIVKGLILITFLMISLWIAPYHEQWADEVQAFLIARDASWAEILTVIPHQEAQPVLWQLVLKVCITLFGSDINIAYVSISIMFIAIALIVFAYPIPLVYKILLPFGYYFLYQYNIIARNYCLAYLALVVLGLCYPKRLKHPYAYALTLIFLAETTSFYSVVAFIFGVRWLYEVRHQLKQTLLPLGLLGLGGLSLLWQIIPMTMEYRTDEYFFPSPILCLHKIIEAFCGWTNISYIILFAVVIGIYLSAAERYIKAYQNYSNILFMIICFLPFFMLFSSIYHTGLIYGLFLCLAYILFPDYLSKGKHYIFLMILVMQIYQGLIFIIYEKMFLYTPVSLVTQTIKNYHLQNPKITTLGYLTLPLVLQIDKKYMYPQTSAQYNNWKMPKCREVFGLNSDVFVISKEGLNCDWAKYENADRFDVYNFHPYAMKGVISEPMTVYIRKNQSLY